MTRAALVLWVLLLPGLAAGEPALSSCDTIVLTDNTGVDEAVVLVDGRRGLNPATCVEDEVLRGSESAAVGNLRQGGACRSEIAVFSDGDRVALLQDPNEWSDGCGDKLDIGLEPILAAPTNLFIVIPDGVAQLAWGRPAPDVAQEDLANAAQIFDENKTGISFDAQHHVLDAQDRQELLDLLPGSLVLAMLGQSNLLSALCALPQAFESKGWYRRGELNVYYLPLPFTGMLCDSDRNVIFVGLIKKPATLAHEFGHSLSLVGKWGHSNPAPGFDKHNLMWVSDSALRDHVSLGQALRFNVEQTSTLNTNGVRSGPVRACLPAAPPAPDCPPLGLDWVRP